MNRVARIVVAGLLLVVATWWASPESAYACSCAHRTETEHAEEADVIFTGTLVQDQISSQWQERMITFAVDEVFKNVATATQVVTTHSSGASCGLEIGGPGYFLVFAERDPDDFNVLTANLCGGTRAGPAPASLGEGHKPLPGPTPPVTGGPDPAGAVPGLRLPAAVFLGLTALAAGGIIGFFIGRRRPRS